MHVSSAVSFHSGCKQQNRLWPSSNAKQLDGWKWERAQGHACCDKVSFVLGVLKALEQPCSEAQRRGVALTEGSANHCPYVDHRALWPHGQATAHCCCTGDELHPQRSHVEHLEPSRQIFVASWRPLDMHVEDVHQASCLQEALSGKSCIVKDTLGTCLVS